MSGKKSGAGGGQVRPQTIDVLNQKRAALVSARERYANAKLMRDEDAMSDESRRIDALRAIIPELEKEVEVEVETAAKAKAMDRMVGIARAYGSLANELDEDEARLRAKLDEARAAIAALNARYLKLQTLTIEAAALADRFAIERPAFRSVASPAHRKLNYSLPSPTHGWMPSPQLERCEHGLRQRRNYTEIKGTPAYRIIEEAGLKAWPELSDRDKRTLAEREREREKMQRQLASLPTIPDFIPTFGGSL